MRQTFLASLLASLNRFFNQHDHSDLAARSLTRLTAQFVCLGICLTMAVGCDKSPPPSFRFNLVEWNKQERLHLSDDESFDEKYKSEVSTILTTLFGTPDEPKFPFLSGDDDPVREVISLEGLKLSAGAVQSDRSGAPSGLYREHCAHCHGVTGDGAGPTAALLNPYPRDFRLSKFKFKSTPLRRPPTDHDLKTILENGIPGTAMPSFRTLPEEELDALIDYVKYLTIRGQHERYLLAEVPGLDGQPIIESPLPVATDGKSSSEDLIKSLEDQVHEFASDGLFEGIVSRWVEPESKVTEVPPAPPEFDPLNPNHGQLVDRGRKLYLDKGNCAQCHGDTGIGDGQLSNYDDWTNDWKVGNVNFNKPETYQEFVDAGAFLPRKILPRNLNQPVYRGGGSPNDLYLRIANGIEGTPMPASSALTPEEKWAVVAYVLSMPYEDKVRPVEKPAD
jgi:mono/diheme cytochrome c family protein